MCIARVSVVLFYVRTESVFYHFLKGILANFGSRLIKVLSAPTLLLLCILLCTLPDPDPDPDHDPDPDRDRAPVSVLLLHQLLCSCSSALAPNLSFLFLGSCCTCCCQRNCVQLLPVAVMLVNYSAFSSSERWGDRCQLPPASSSQTSLEVRLVRNTSNGILNLDTCLSLFQSQRF